MKLILFTGPTLSPDQARNVVDAVCLPPVTQGDVFRAACHSPIAIGIIDGYFERVPSVWHKEILWAMSQGVHVFGSASMGALRAAELASFGMIGVGTIFELYRDGVLEDDDEVAVAHGPAELGYRALSDAMVNIRTTLTKAHAGGILAEATRNALERIAKELFYPERSYPHIFARAVEQGLPEQELNALQQWLPHGAVNQKYEDAMAMLGVMRDLVESDPEPKQVSYTFAETNWWNAIRQSWEVSLDSLGADAQVLAELVRDPATHSRAMSAALGWWLAAQDASHGGYELDAASILVENGKFCGANGISTPEHVESWLSSNACTRRELERMVKSRALALRAHASAPAGLSVCLLDYLRWTGDYATLLAKSRQRDQLST